MVLLLQQNGSVSIKKSDNNKFAPVTVSWDPHSSSACALSTGTSLSLYDMRKMEVTASLDRAHDGMIRSLIVIILTISIPFLPLKHFIY